MSPSLRRLRTALVGSGMQDPGLALRFALECMLVPEVGKAECTRVWKTVVAESTRDCDTAVGAGDGVSGEECVAEDPGRYNCELPDSASQRCESDEGGGGCLCYSP